jgi:hypothetical protein
MEKSSGGSSLAPPKKQTRTKDEDEEDRTEIALMKRLTSIVVALGSQAVVSFAHRQINWVGVAVEGRVGGGYKA